MNNTKKAKWIGCLAAVAVFAVAGTATANAKDHHRHDCDGGNTAVQIVRAIVDLLDGPDVIVTGNPAPAPVIVQSAPRVQYVNHVTTVRSRPVPPRREVRYAPPRKEVKPAPKHHEKKAKVPAKKPAKGKGGRR